ncbi:MAG: ABC transporter permease, partial [Bacteroidales bacterium]|nr:ABC transporter permease [Bacteroidales bacterium]
MKSYLRFLGRNKLYTAIEVVGLSVSLAFVVLIGTYVWQQYSVARDCEDYERIFTIGRQDGNSKVLGLRFDSPGILKANIPEIEQAGCYYNIFESPTKLDGEVVPVENICVDKEFFEMFNIRFISGSADVFDDVNNVVVSESFANDHGGLDKIIGSRINKRGPEQIVAGVIEDFDNEMFAYCDIIHNINLRGRPVPYIHDSYTFIKLREGVRIEDVEEKVKTEVQKIFDSSPFDLGFEPFILRYDEVFFAGDTDFANCLNNADSRTLKIMLAVVLILLFSAMVNFINLSAAMSGKRIKEMATRMVSGADRKSIFRRYVAESVGISIFCTVAAVLIAIAFEPSINRLVQSDIPIQVSLSPICIIIYLATGLAIGLTASILPASIGISISPMNVLKGQFKANGKKVFGKIFIALQNAVSIVLIALAIMMELQMRHLADRPVGADIDDLYYLWLDDIKSRGPLEEEIRKMPFVTRIGLSEGYPGGLVETLIEVEPGNDQLIGLLICDTEAFDMYNFKRKTDNGVDVGNSAWVDQYTYESMASYGADLNTPQGMMAIPLASPDTRFGGLLDDFAIFDAITDSRNVWCNVRVSDTGNFSTWMSDGGGLLIQTIGDHRDNGRAIMEAYRKYSEERNGIYMEPMTAGYIGDLLTEKLTEAKSNMRIMELFMFLSILLSFMGLVAMSTYFSSEST